MNTTALQICTENASSFEIAQELFNIQLPVLVLVIILSPVFIVAVMGFTTGAMKSPKFWLILGALLLLQIAMLIALPYIMAIVI